MSGRTLYFSTTAGAVTITPSASWHGSILAAVTKLTRATKQNTAFADTAGLQPFGVGSVSTRWMSFLTDPLREDYLFRTISDVSLIIRGSEDAPTEDAYLTFVLRVMQGDTSTQRGLLAEALDFVNEFGTTPSTRFQSSIPFISNVQALAGDRLCLEIGIWGDTPAGVVNATLRFGDPTGTADFAFTEGLTTDLDPWWRISADPVFTTDPQTATATPSIRLSLGATAVISYLAAATPRITLGLVSSGLAIAQATAGPSIRLSMLAAVYPLAQASPRITLTLATTIRGIVAAVATPMITLSLTLAASSTQHYQATAAPSIRLRLGAAAVGGTLPAGSTVVELEYNASGSTVSIDQRIAVGQTGASAFTLSVRD